MVRKKVLITAQWLEDVGTEIDVTFDKLSVTFSLEWSVVECSWIQIYCKWSCLSTLKGYQKKKPASYSLSTRLPVFTGSQWWVFARCLQHISRSCHTRKTRVPCPQPVGQGSGSHKKLQFSERQRGTKFQHHQPVFLEISGESPSKPLWKPFGNKKSPDP